MLKMPRRDLPRNPIRAATLALAISLTTTALARAAECPRQGPLGTSRSLAVEPVDCPRIGLKSFPQTLPLRDHEVVLTFDDGPWPPTTPKVLATLSKQCVLATFFLIGRPALEYPTMVRRIAAEGHSIGTHTWSHSDLQAMPRIDAFAEIDDGIAAVEWALHGVATTAPTTPFFR